MKIIFIEIKGGMGNQLFQYAFSKLLMKHKNVRIKLVDKTMFGADNATFSLDFWDINPEIITNREFRLPYIYLLILKKIKTIFGSDENDVIYTQKSSSLFEGDALTAKSKYYIGYWGNEKYFKNFRTELLNELKPRSKPSPACKSILDDIIKCDAVALHVRRGDYITNKNVNDVFGIDYTAYYKKAVALINEKVKNPIYYVFSDDKSWCEKNLSHLANNMVFYEREEGKNTNWQIVLTSKCKHVIVTNSTFGWWGAWLNQNNDKIVIAPKNWVKGEKNKQAMDVIPDEWIKL